MQIDKAKWAKALGIDPSKIKTFTIKMTGACKAKGCDGIVGKIFPIQLDDNSDVVMLGFPCNKCGAVHGTRQAKEIIKDPHDNFVFYEKGNLVFRNASNKLVRRDNSRLRSIPFEILRPRK